MTSADDPSPLTAYSRIFEGISRFGPGGADITESVIESIRASLPRQPRVADMACGAGEATLALARALPGADILAVDLAAPFLEVLNERARAAGVAERIETRAGDMAEPARLGLADASLDLIWAESAVYAVGLDRALAAWRPLLRDHGWLVFNDLVWLVADADRPEPTRFLFAAEYPAMADPDTVEACIRRHGLTPRRCLTVPRRGWADYYEPLRARLAHLKPDARPDSPLAAVIAGLEQEIAVFDADDGSFGCVFWACEPT